MIGTREQAQVYLAQGSLCRAAAIMTQIVNAEPTNENLELLAEIFMQQGLNEDAMALYARTVSSHVSTVSYVN